MLLAMHTTRSHLEMLTRIKRPRLSLPCERERTCQNQNTGVEGMGVRWGGVMRRERFPFDSLPLAFPLGCNLCSIHALCSISMKVCDLDPLYHTLCTDAIQSILHQTHHHLGAGVGW
jgi:hypothetical protein